MDSTLIVEEPWRISTRMGLRIFVTMGYIPTRSARDSGGSGAGGEGEEETGVIIWADWQFQMGRSRDVIGLLEVSSAPRLIEMQPPKHKNIQEYAPFVGSCSQPFPHFENTAQGPLGNAEPNVFSKLFPMISISCCFI